MYSDADELNSLWKRVQKDTRNGKLRREMDDFSTIIEQGALLEPQKLIEILTRIESVYEALDKESKKAIRKIEDQESASSAKVVTHVFGKAAENNPALLEVQNERNRQLTSHKNDRANYGETLNRIRFILNHPVYRPDPGYNRGKHY